MKNSQCRPRSTEIEGVRAALIEGENSGETKAF